MDIGGSTRCSSATNWRAIPRRCGGSCVAMAGWRRVGGRGRGMGDGTRGRYGVAEPNRRWASDITSIRVWNGQKGRMAIMIDCADRMVLAWRFAWRITGRGSGRDAAGGCVPAVRGSAGPSTGDRVPQRQWAGVYVASVPAVCAGDNADPMPYTSAKLTVKRFGAGVLLQLRMIACTRRT